jgi:hypothetical protein
VTLIYTGDDPVNAVDPTGQAAGHLSARAVCTDEHARDLSSCSSQEIKQEERGPFDAYDTCEAASSGPEALGVGLLVATGGIGDLAEALGSAADAGDAAATGAASSFVPGGLYETTISTSAGNVGVLAEVGVDGSQLTLSDVTIYGESGDLVNEVGPGQFLALRNAIVQEAASEGFDSLRITGTRVASSSSSAPGKIINIVINLGK